MGRYEQFLGLLQGAGMAEMKEIVDAVSVDTNRAVSRWIRIRIGLLLPSLACAAPALPLSRTLRLGLGLLGVMGVEGAEQRWGSRVRVSVYHRPPRRLPWRRRSRASPVSPTLSLSRLSQPVRGVRVSGFRGVERVREMRGRERGSGTRGEKVN